MSEQNLKKKVKKVKRNHPKRVHLSLVQIDQKITLLEEKIKGLQGVEIRNKRLRYYREVVLLKKAKENPEIMVIDPKIKKEKQEAENMKRIAKKMLKKKQAIAQKRTEHNKKRRINCLYCQKCIVNRWAFNARV